MTPFCKHCLLLPAMLFTCLALNAQNNFNFDMEQTNQLHRAPADWSGQDISIDSGIRQNGNYSLLIEKGTHDFGVAMYLVKSTFQGKKLTLTGYVKTESVKDGWAGLWMRVDGESKPGISFDNMENRGITGTTDWKQYTIELDHHEDDATDIYLGGLITGQGKIWIDNLQLLADGVPVNKAVAKKIVLSKAAMDTAFARASGIDSIPVTKTVIGNLTNLGLLWGFLKYHHPSIAKGDYNCDAELFRILPKVIAAQNTESANAILEQWVDALGKPDHCATCREIKKDSNTKLLPDYGNLFRPGNFSSGFISKLDYIKNNRNQGKHYYIDLYPGVRNPEFKHENPYAGMDYPDAGYRILALFRYWNMIQYFFPYKHLIGEDWNKVLPEFLPVFVQARDTLAYHMACLRLIARVHDTHANIWSYDKPINNYYGNYYAPVQTRFIENKLVITGFYTDTLDILQKLKKGDIITTIDQEKVADKVKRLLPETPASNYETQLRDLPGKLLRGNTDKITLGIERDHQTITVVVDRFRSAKLNRNIDYDPAPKDSGFKLINTDIGYVFPGKYKNKDLPAIKALFKNTRGIIVDMRCYPSDFMPFTFGNYIKSSATPFVKFTKGNVATPGLFTTDPDLSNGGDSMAYQGKVVVIVNASTQSQAEYTTMAFQSSSNVTVIGSTTAGADGNVSAIYLPGNIFTWISGIGVYYPDGTETQRKGVKIDVPIKPTIKGIKEGRDELLEKAIQIIDSQTPKRS